MTSLSEVIIQSVSGSEAFVENASLYFEKRSLSLIGIGTLLALKLRSIRINTGDEVFMSMTCMKEQRAEHVTLSITS